jgi:hypothetical protein
MSKLNQDILLLIFEELQDDSKTLFSCLMVNRTWSETVIPILWKDPWRYNIDYSTKDKLFDIIAFYVYDDIKEFLTEQGLLLISRKPPLFDYLSFCKSINVDVIRNISTIGSSITCDQFYLQEKFYNILIKKSIKFLDMRTIKHQLFYFPEAKDHLKSICELTCDSSIDSSYFYGFARYCQYIQNIIFINKNTKVNRGIIRLIEKQKNLRSFEWKDDFDDDYYIGDPYKDILRALEKKAYSIYHLKMYFLYIYRYEYTTLQEIFPKFCKLKTLTIDDFCFFTKDQLKSLVYRDIEILNIDYVTLDTASSIIENSGGKLRKILLKYCDYYNYEDYFNQDSLIFIRKIHENCPQIEYLSLVFSSSEEHFNEFEKLLKICQNLKSLLIIISNIDNEETFEKISNNGKKLLEILVRSASINLREIRFFEDFKFSLDALEIFLKNWKGRPAISLITSDIIYEDDDYINLINEYKSYGVIKEFRRDFERNIYF